ncbi:hypothetical protein BN381_80253 [Candidatus Microthrix parvicella RN1]|uniref:Uncharacterized protein n=1 Tax=Candidatus Neomicrothrix parvicella RN1 TaxID=1229780 RepID=R4Z4R9_9ACTN|nr:hypothetical protein BN381_80253 [Candidatus Microthrix parvicella RN1]
MPSTPITTTRLPGSCKPASPAVPHPANTRPTPKSHAHKWPSSSGPTPDNPPPPHPTASATSQQTPTTTTPSPGWSAPVSPAAPLPANTRPTRKSHAPKWPSSSGSTAVDSEPPATTGSAMYLLSTITAPRSAGWSKPASPAAPLPVSTRPTRKSHAPRWPSSSRTTPAASRPSPGDRYHHPHKLRSARSIIESTCLVPTERAAFGPKTATLAARGEAHPIDPEIAWDGPQLSRVALVPYLTMGLG